MNMMRKEAEAKINIITMMQMQKKNLENKTGKNGNSNKCRDDKWGENNEQLDKTHRWLENEKKRESCFSSTSKLKGDIVTTSKV